MQLCGSLNILQQCLCDWNENQSFSSPVATAVLPGKLLVNIV